MYYKKAKHKVGVPAKRSSLSYSFPACTGGINALDPLIRMPDLDCIYTDNLMPSEYGLRLRKGYSQWATGVTGAVRTIIPFEGQAASAGSDKLFCVSENGIWDVTLFNDTSPAQVVTFFTTGPESGYGVFTEFTNDASERYLMYADAQNGLHRYQENGVWDVPPITSEDGNFNVAKVAFVVSWKNRLWFVEQDSGDAWYLPPDAIQGVVTKFTFGSKFTHGGELMGLWNWTVDGGDGIDDFLVAVSRGGDVLVYHGTDPILPDFGLRGSYFIGEVPESRRLGVSHGGELYLLSTYGITSIRDLLQGHEPGHAGSPSAKISRALRAEVQEGKDEFNWSLHIHPADGFLQIVTPFDQQGNAFQYCQNLLTKGWGRWQGVPLNCAETWNGEYYFGTLDGEVFIYDGTLDGTLLDGTVGEPVNFEILTTFQAPENHATYKRVGIIRPIGIAAGTASINVKAVYDYKIETRLQAPPPLGASEGSEWDDAKWDEDVWDYTLSGSSLPVGALGIGRAFAVGMKGSASTRITILGWDVMYTVGDYL